MSKSAPASSTHNSGEVSQGTLMRSDPVTFFAPTHAVRSRGAVDNAPGGSDGRVCDRCRGSRRSDLHCGRRSCTGRSRAFESRGHASRLHTISAIPAKSAIAPLGSQTRLPGLVVLIVLTLTITGCTQGLMTEQAAIATATACTCNCFPYGSRHYTVPTGTPTPT